MSKIENLRKKFGIFWTKFKVIAFKNNFLSMIRVFSKVKNILIDTFSIINYLKRFF